MSEEGMLLEYETAQAAEGQPLSTCPQCGWQTHRSYCPECTNAAGEPLPLTGDITMDEVSMKLENGEEFDLEHALRFGEFIPVTIEDLKGRDNG